jgi:hypothetical protein
MLMNLLNKTIRFLPRAVLEELNIGLASVIGLLEVWVKKKLCAGWVPHQPVLSETESVRLEACQRLLASYGRSKG